MVASFSSGSGTNIGLAVGLPIAVLALFILGGFGWWVWKKKQFSAIKKEELPYADENWRDYANPNGFNGPENLSSSTYSSTKPSSNSNLAMKCSTAQRKPEVERNLLGKAILQKLRTAEFKQSTPQTPRRISQLISPIFLKPFNLTRAKEPKELPPTPGFPYQMKQNETTNTDDTDSSLTTNVQLSGNNSSNNNNNRLNLNLKSSNLDINSNKNHIKDKTKTKNRQPLAGLEKEKENIKKHTINRPSDSERQVIRAYQKLFDYELSVEPPEIIKVLEFHSDG